MEIADAYSIDKSTHLPARPYRLKTLINKKVKSFNEVFQSMKEGDHIHVLVEGRGYKQLSIESGEHYIQRNFSYEI